MLKKLFILVFILAIIALASVPMWTTYIADSAFKKPELPNAPEMLDKSIRLKMYFYMYSDAKKIAEKAVIYFPESKFTPGYIYSAALCAEKEKNIDAAIYWYNYFLERYPKHSWAGPTQNALAKLKEMHQ